MSALKFTEAKFYDFDLGEWCLVTPNNYVPDLHAGRLECPETGCHASLSFRSCGATHAFSQTRVSHFASNRGEPHSEFCVKSPEPSAQMALNMRDALQAGKYILLNINFSTSYDREKGRLKAKFAKSAMHKWQGFVRSEWIKAHGKTQQHDKRYESFSCPDFTAMADRLAAFKKACAMLGGNARYTDRLMVSYLHGVVPWTRFFAKDFSDPTVAKAKPAFKPLLVGDVVDLLQGDMMTAPYAVKRIWGAAPVLRMNLELYKNARETTSSQLHANRFRTQNKVQVGSVEYLVQDVVQVPDAHVRAAIQAAKSFSFVATPNICRDSLDKVRSGQLDRVQVNWPICSRSQVSLTP